jgi:hypothetical protein
MAYSMPSVRFVGFMEIMPKLVCYYFYVR